MANKANIAGKSVTRKSFPNKVGKVPKKIHKAEKEKLKHDQLNELFNELGHALEPACQNNGKASILGDATRLLQDLLKQVECLRWENKALLTESHYITEEKNELRGEKIVLEAGIKKLRNDLEERTHCGPVWTNGKGPMQAAYVASDTLVQSQHASSALQSHETHLRLPSVDPPTVPLVLSPIMGPMIVFPLHPDHQALQGSNTVIEHSSKLQVNRPHPRYPTPLDSWPSQLLVKQPRTAQGTQNSSSNGNGGEECSRSVEDGQCC